MIVSILVFIASCIILDKAGERWWKMFIPFYSEYTMYKVAGKAKLWWIQLLCSLVAVCSLTYMFVLFMEIWGPLAMNANPAQGDVIIEGFVKGLQTLIATPAFIITMCLSSMVSMVSFVISIIFNVSLAKSFGQSPAFAIGLILVQPIFMCILAFGKFDYVGSEKSIETVSA